METKENANAGFTDEEKKAMAERSKELASIRKRSARPKIEDLEKEVFRKISEMNEPDRTIATNIHALIKRIAPNLTPRTWYGMPAYEKDESIICFFQERGKFKTRYATIGFSDKAHLDDGALWPTAFALPEWNEEVDERLRELIKKAIS
ncbi:MAG: hypothetical protein JRN19_03360 [Nitrososphaerota archaeon]|nr:hypothetical protein [Nitrososphaerota archaeon]MDG7051469.1 hypothetical protein [Nitrososphaerota archaeon]